MANNLKNSKLGKKIQNQEDVFGKTVFGKNLFGKNT